MLGGAFVTSLRILRCGKRRPDFTDPEEPKHVAEAVAHLNLAHTVITSVNRDDLADGGAAHGPKPSGRFER